jgi:DNA-binding NarL/FixJ family response regulator
VLTNLPNLRAEEDSVAPKRIFLLIAHIAFRDALASVLNRMPDLEVVSQASSIAEAVNYLEHNIDIALVDPSLSDGDGLAVVRQLSSRRNAANTAPIALVLTTSSGSDPAIFKRALQADAVGVYSTACSLDELVDAIRSSAWQFSE